MEDVYHAQEVHASERDRETAQYDSMPGKFSTISISAISQKTEGPLMAGKIGNALEAKGFVEPYLTIPNQAFINPKIFTVSFWIKIDPKGITRDNSSIISHVNKTGAAGWFFVLRLKPELHVELSILSADSVLHSVSAPILPAKFDNILASFNGTVIKIYSNGVLIRETNFTGEYKPNPGTPLIVGLSSYRVSKGVTVLIDELRLYNRALTDKEAKDLFNNTQNTSTSTGLIGYWPFDEGTQDLSRNHNDGILEKHPVITYDQLGIPIVDYGEINGTYIGAQRNPITVSATAIEAYDRYRHTGNETDKESVIHNADWLNSHSIPHDGFSMLEYHFIWPPYDLHPVWVSGMAQGLAIKALVYAHQITGDDKYLHTVKKLLNSFFVDVVDGGVTHKDSEKAWWYEEYPKQGGGSPRVLNGMMYTLLAIHEYYKYTNDTSAKFLFDRGITSLVANLPTYDEPRYSYSFYDSFHTTTPLFYHKIHLKLLADLYEISGIDLIKYYRDRWENFVPPPYLSLVN
jgi:heparosan-N-sulfate-glucuronate 5-epimerase